MIDVLRNRANCRTDRSPEGGYVAVMTALLFVVLMGLSAFAVDVGRWYVVGQQEQRAADAAALAGVTNLPEDQVKAFSTARNFSRINGFDGAVPGTTVTPVIDGAATRLRVSVTKTVDNIFGPLLGVPKTTISRTAVADYAGPVPLGSPCNEYGDDPEPGTGGDDHRSTNCDGTGAFWANVGSPQAPKVSGDAYQNEMATNTDFDADGYFYTVTLTKDIANLSIEVFDPAMINVGDFCEKNNLSGAKTLDASVTVGTNPSTRYAEGATSTYCTGDNRFGGTGEVSTEFTVRSPGPNPWDPLSFPVMTDSCAPKKFEGYNGDLKNALDKTNAAYTARPDVADNFRQWKRLCKITNALKGSVYMIQVKTNEPFVGGGVGNDAASGHNRFSLRAYAGSSGNDDEISVAGYAKMGMYGNTPNGTSKFYLAKVPSGSKGHLFNVSLFDIGDGAKPGSTITVLPPSDTGSPASFTDCTGIGPTIGTGPLPNCQIQVDSSYNGKWETISVPISSSYTCNDTLATGCWVRLEFYYGPGSGPADTTSWTANIQGDPVRLVE